MSATRVQQPGRILLIGADGMLGKAWEQFLSRSDVEYDAVARSRAAPNCLDVTDEDAVEACISRGYDWIINCAAYTAVDAAETDEKNAYAVNGVAVGNIARSAARRGAAVVHYSTDYVFDGVSSSPYPIDHPLAPINAYGRSKACGEEQLAAAECDSLLIRTSWVYGPWGKNFVLTMRKLLATQSQVSVVDDQRGRPTSVETLVNSTWALMLHQCRGTFHVTDGGECSWFEFAQEIRSLMGVTCEVLPCTTARFPRPAQRPHYSVLDLVETERIVGHLPSWKLALAETLRQVSHSEP